MTRKNKTNDSKLSDNPTSKLLPSFIEQTEMIQHLVRLLQDKGIEHEILKHVLLGARITLEYADYIDVAERFNDIYAKHGWIATESFCIDTMRNALAYHDEERFEEAEDVILEWFNETRIEILAIGRCGYFGKNESRKAQLQEAFELTQEERYLSAVPLILIACDGFARDVLNVELFKQKNDLTAFDTLVGHSSALPTLVRELTKDVEETSAAISELPGRHGIMHGRILGYATESNCMKAWLLFIALTDLHIEREHNAETSPEEPIPVEMDIQDAALALLERGQREARLRG